MNKYLEKGLAQGKPTFIRYPNGDEFLPENFSKFDESLYYYNKGSKTNGIIITYGSIVKEAITAAKQLEKQNFNCGIILLEQLKPLPTDAILKLLPADIPVIFLEEGTRAGGVGTSLIEETHNHPTMRSRPYTVLAIDSFAEGVKGETLYQTCGISAEDIVKAFHHNK